MQRTHEPFSTDVTDEGIEHAAGSALAWITELAAPEVIGWQKIFDDLAREKHPCGAFAARTLRNLIAGEGEPATHLDILALAWIMRSGGWDTIL